MKKISIDYFDGQYAKCEDFLGNTLDIKRELIPKNAVEGDILTILKNGTIKIDKEETLLRREKIASLQNKIFNKGEKNEL